MSTSDPGPFPAGDRDANFDRRIHADPVELPVLQAGLADIRAAIAAGRADAPPDTWWYAFETACVEILVNAIRYAYGDRDRNRPIDVHLSAGPHSVRMILRDWGRPFTGDLDRSEPPDGLAESGRGIWMARQLVDTLRYAREEGGVNYWLVEKVLSR